MGTDHPSAHPVDHNLFGANPRVGFPPFLQFYPLSGTSKMPFPYASALPLPGQRHGDGQGALALSHPPKQKQLKLGSGAHVFLTRLFSLNIEVVFFCFSAGNKSLQQREAQTPSCFGPALSQRSLAGGGNACELWATPAHQQTSFASVVCLRPRTIKGIQAKGLFCSNKQFRTRYQNRA